MRFSRTRAACLAPVTRALAAGGGGSEPGAERQDLATAPATAETATALAARRPAPTNVHRRAAAAAAIGQSRANGCAAARPFYWQIGTRDGPVRSGSVGGNRITAGTVLPYASASKWLYSDRVVQRTRGVLRRTDVQMLTLRSGCTRFTGCQPGQTVDACLASIGIVARVAPNGAWRASAKCGRLIRQACASGVALQTGATSPAAPSARAPGAPAPARRR
jgi:hypothetical protein